MIHFAQFSIYLIFLILNDIDFVSYVDDKTLVKHIITLIRRRKISECQDNQDKWLQDNQMKYNTDRLHLILSTEDSNQNKTGNSNFLVLNLIINLLLTRTSKAFVKKEKQN